MRAASQHDARGSTFIAAGHQTGEEGRSTICLLTAVTTSQPLSHDREGDGSLRLPAPTTPAITNVCAHTVLYAGESATLGRSLRATLVLSLSFGGRTVTAAVISAVERNTRHQEGVTGCGKARGTSDGDSFAGHFKRRALERDENANYARVWAAGMQLDVGCKVTPYLSLSLYLLRTLGRTVFCLTCARKPYPTSFNRVTTVSNRPSSHLSSASSKQNDGRSNCRDPLEATCWKPHRIRS